MLSFKVFQGSTEIMKKQGKSLFYFLIIFCQPEDSGMHPECEYDEFGFRMETSEYILQFYQIQTFWSGRLKFTLKHMYSPSAYHIHACAHAHPYTMSGKSKWTFILELYAVQHQILVAMYPFSVRMKKKSPSSLRTPFCNIFINFVL